MTSFFVIEMPQLFFYTAYFLMHSWQQQSTMFSSDSNSMSSSIEAPNMTDKWQEVRDFMF